MSTNPNPTQPAVVTLSDAEVDRIATAVAVKVQHILLPGMPDSPKGRYLGATLASTYNAVQAIKRKLGA